MFSVFQSPISSFFCKTREVCSQIAEIRIRVQNDPKDTVFVLELQKISTQNTKKHITQNTCAQHTNPDFMPFFVTFSRNHPAVQSQHKKTMIMQLVIKTTAVIPKIVTPTLGIRVGATTKKT